LCCYEAIKETNSRNTKLFTTLVYLPMFYYVSLEYDCDLLHANLLLCSFVSKLPDDGYVSAVDTKLSETFMVAKVDW